MEGVDHLADERNKAEFDVDSMKIVWAGSRHAFEVSDRIARLVASDPVFVKSNRGLLTRKELFKSTLKKCAHALKRIVELRLTEEEAGRLRFFVDQPAYVDLHWGMFVPAIKGQGTEEQQQKWLTLANKMQIIGCYAQTEIRSLQSNLKLEEIQEKDAKLRKEVTEMEEKLIKLRKGVTLVRPEDKKAIEDMYSDKITQWRKRKRMFKDVWDTVTENFPRDNKELKEELVIEYDEEKKDGLCSR